MHKIKKRFATTYLGLLICWLCFLGCATAPATITDKSGDSDLAGLLESIRVKERLPALAAAIIIDGKIYATAAVGTRKAKTNNWVTVDDKFLIASCSKAFTATLSTLHSPPDSTTWRTGSEEKGYGVPSLNYALGWYTFDIDDKEGLIWHPGGNRGFIAQVIVDPDRKNAILVVTNVRASHRHLFKAMNRIKEHYSSIADLPVIKIK